MGPNDYFWAVIDVNKLIGIGVTLLFVGFFAGIEIAFVSANKLSIELKKKQGLRSGLILSQFMEAPAKFIGTTLIGINIMVVVYGLLVSEFSAPIWELFPSSFVNPYLRLVVETIISTLIVLLVEFFFKAFFRSKNDSVLRIFAPLLKFFYNIFYPIASFFVGFAEWILKYLFNVRLYEKKDFLNRVDLEHFIQQTKEQSEDNNELNTDLFEAALSLPNIKIRQCLVPRKEIEAVDIRTPIDEVKQKFIDSKLSKLVVYDSNIDTIQGYLHQLDLFKKPTDIKAILLPIPAVPESMSVTGLMTKFSKERKSIAWVVDEFGGTAGIITMEDLLEEIFGDIRDEYDTEEFVEKQISTDEYIFSGRLEVDYLNEKYGFDFSENASETLSGFIIHQHETIPKLKERIIIDDYEFDILNVSDTRIDMVKVKRLK
jgi:CBS domain containing-hemolysin-like protein